MKKIYSFALMAAMLLLGTNVKATTVDTEAEFYAAWEQSGDVTIDLEGDITLTKTVWLGTVNENDAARKVVINLNGHELELTKGFLLTHGTLEINGNENETWGNQGSTVSGGTSVANELFFVTGARNPEKENFTNLKIGKGVLVNYETYKAAISIDRVPTSGRAYSAIAASACSPAKDQLSYNTNIYTGFGAAFGVNVEVAGKITATRYAVKANGDLGYEAATKDKTPFIHICNTAYIYVPAEAQGQTKKPLALYASGYARWLIEGEVTGNVGVAVKSGDVDINGATITSNNTTSYTPANESSSGSKAEGSAVVISSEKAYSGEIDVTISNGATMTAGAGYALDESVATPSNGTKVDAITVEGGTFNAGTSSEGAITISATTAQTAVSSTETSIEVTSAKIDGSITIGGTKEDPTDPGQQVEIKLDDFVTTSAVIEDSDPSTPTIVVPLDINLTNDGYASFSAPINLYKATGKTGYVEFGIYTGVYDAENNELDLIPVDYVQAGQGVIFYRNPEVVSDGKCHLTTSGTLDTSYPSNDLKASADWDLEGNHGSIYCLRNVGGVTMFYQYVGAAMPDNKAYLDFSQMNHAPQHIRMVIAQEEQTEAIESVEAANVKAVKFIENGEILIRRGENVYNLQGQIVK